MSGDRRVGVIGVADERWGEVPVAVVVRRAADARSTEAGVAALLRGRLARYKHPKRIVFVGDLPKTALGKVRKDILAARMNAAAAPPSAPG